MLSYCYPICPSVRPQPFCQALLSIRVSLRLPVHLSGLQPVWPLDWLKASSQFVGSQHICLPVCPTASLFATPSILAVSLSGLPASLFASPSVLVFPAPSLSFRQPALLSSPSQPICLASCLSVKPSDHLSVFQPVLSVGTSVQPVRLPTHLSTSPSVRPPAHLSSFWLVCPPSSTSVRPPARLSGLQPVWPASSPSGLPPARLSGLQPVCTASSPSVRPPARPSGLQPVRPASSPSVRPPARLSGLQPVCPASGPYVQPQARMFVL